MHSEKRIPAISDCGTALNNQKETLSHAIFKIVWKIYIHLNLSCVQKYGCQDHCSLHYPEVE